MIARKREHFVLPSALKASVLLSLQGAIIMNPNGVRKSEQIKLIMECRRDAPSKTVDLTGFFACFVVYLMYIKCRRKTMPRSAKDIQLIELKDTISKLNELISTQTRSMESLNKTIEDLRQELSNKQAEVDYLKAKLFGSSSEKLKAPFPGQMNLFEAELPDPRDHRTGDN